MASLPGKVSPHAYEEIQKDYCKNIRLEVPRKSREIFCDAGTSTKSTPSMQTENQKCSFGRRSASERRVS
jgi:hypothetical protein